MKILSLPISFFTTVKNLNLQDKKLRNFYFLPLASVIFVGALFLLVEKTLANNAVLRSIFSCQAQGLGGATPTINVWYQQGTNLSFIPAGETIRKVWLNDPSQVTVDFDGQLCAQFGQDRNSGEDCQNSSANVMQLRRIKKLNIPGLPSTENTLLTVVTQGQGRTKLYTFRVLYEEGSPAYHTLAVFPDPSSSREAPCVRVPKS
ncbi:hypothetical protein [Fortiea contorta]|uniref:hypothetical protein n=1 Tax=Fortiea contorta TaxID=1892405 RepID=UPI00034A8180|nr:hypothetical protein [Fortiea contorta]